MEMSDKIGNKVLTNLKIEEEENENKDLTKTLG